MSAPRIPDAVAQAHEIMESHEELDGRAFDLWDAFEDACFEWGVDPDEAARELRELRELRERASSAKPVREAASTTAEAA